MNTGKIKVDSDSPAPEKSLEGKAKGGAARAKSLSANDRKQIAKKAAESRWSNANIPIAEFHGELKFGDLVFPCAVLSDGTRVVSETAFMSGLGMYRSGALSVRREADAETGAQIPLYLAFKNLKPFVIKYLGDVHTTQLKYRTMSGAVGHGIQATLIPKICSIWLDARKANVLGPRQQDVADKAELLLRGFAEVGIIALVDEATGFQNYRAKNALAQILEQFIAKELQPYVKTFPAEFYEELFRLRGLSFPPDNLQFRPQYFGKLTNDIVYERLAPGLLRELKKQAAKDAKKAHLHRRLTQEIGHPKLREHLAAVIMAMKMSKDYPSFITALNKHFPRYGETHQLDLEDTDQ